MEIEAAISTFQDSPIECLSGWTELWLGRNQKSTLEMFERAINGRYFDGYIGKMAIYSSRQLANDMKAIAKDSLSVSFSHLPFHIEAIKACILAKEWNNALQAIQNSNLVEADNVYILFLLAVYTICSAGSKISQTLDELQSALDVYESDNHSLFGFIAQCLYRMAARNKTVLKFSRELLARANKKCRRVDYVVDELRVAVSLNDVREVTVKVKELMTMDSNDPYATLAVTLSNLMLGKVDDALAQLNFMKEANPAISDFAIYHFVAAVLAKYKDKSFEKFMKMINDSINIHIDKTQSIEFGIKYLRSLDTDFLMGIVYQIMDYAPLAPTKAPDDTLKTCERILNIIVDNCPGICQAYFILARCYFLHSEWDTADRMIEQCLQKDETIADAYLLRAEASLIKLMKGQINDADTCLNTGLSFNFSVRDSPLFHLIKAKLHKQKNELEKAADLLKSGLKIPQKEHTMNLLMQREAGNGQRMAIQLELIDCLQSMKQTVSFDRSYIVQQ
ncbi:hypothetical protein DICVIV_13393 [Dictyocaulus viviparus]|uniref:Tetratricopeptide repeat protein n=1 Tax=Dictyocaulus viviparus TaxID=29172 RepID=A0A0D8XA56_DICVI|nr:hypothetical protein DICVIV_13393 [Dictyocaulus viviparus]